ncbi:MAG: hypothetical protein R3C45_02565 [Phycisphaerales bacterium]
MLLEQMHEVDGVCVLLSTHDRAFAERICSRVIDLSDYRQHAQAVADV